MMFGPSLFAGNCFSTHSADTCGFLTLVGCGGGISSRCRGFTKDVTARPVPSIKPLPEFKPYEAFKYGAYNQ